MDRDGVDQRGATAAAPRLGPSARLDALDDPVGTQRQVSDSDHDRERRTLTAPRPGPARRRRRWSRAAGWTAFAAVALLVFAAAAWQRYVASGTLANEVRRAIATELQQSLGREVVLFGVSGDAFHGVTLHGLRIAEQGGFGRGVAFSTDEIRLSFDWPSLLLLRTDVIGMITRADLVRPRVVISRSSTGIWNIDDLLAHQGARGAARFHGRIVAAGGIVVFRDALDVPAPFAATFERVGGEVGFLRGDEITLALAGVTPDGGDVRLAGRYRAGGNSEFDIAAANASAAHWGGYLVRVSELTWTGGRFGGQVHVTLTPTAGSLGLDFLATLRVHDTDLLYQPARLSLRHASGPITVDGRHAETPGLTGYANGSPLVIDGAIVFGGGPWIELGLKSPALDLGTVQALFFPKARLTLTGKAGAALQIVGPVGAPDIDGEFTGARGRLNGQAFNDLHTKMQYAAGMLTLADLRSSVAGGRLRGSLVLDVASGTPAYLFSGTTHEVDVAALSSLGLTGLNKVSGRMSGRLAGAGTGTQVQVLGDVTMGRGSIQGLGFDGAHAVFWHDSDGRVDLDFLKGRVGRATVYSSGQIAPDGAMDLDVFAHDVSLLELGAWAGRQGRGTVSLDGQADLVGRATGTTAAPVLSGKVTASHGRVGPVAFAEARGSITISPTGMTVPHLEALNGLTRYRVSGGLTFRPPAASALRIEAEDVDARWLTAALPLAPEMTGTMGATLVIDGSLARPSITGHVVLDHGSVQGQRIDHAEAQLVPDSGRIHIGRAEARVNGSRLTAAGTIDPAGPVDLRLSAENIHFSDITAALGLSLPAEGTFALSGEVHGTLVNPTVSGQISAPEFVVREEKFAASGALDYEGGILRLSGLQLVQGSSRYRLSGEIRPGPRPTAGLILDVDHGRVATALAAAGIKPPVPLDGEVNGRIEFSGPLDDPSARLSLTLRNAAFGAYAIGDGAADLTLTHQAIDIDRFEIHPVQGQVAAKGRVDLRGTSSVEISAQDLDPDFLRPFFQLDRPLEGRLNFALQFSGPTQNPKAGVSLEALDTGVSGVVADRIAALAFYSSGTLTIEHGVISKGPHKVVVLGTLPVDTSTFLLDAHAPLQLQLRLQDADLSFLSLLTPKITDASGTVAGEVRVGGTIEAPQMTGFLRSAGGRFRYAPLRTPVEDLTVDLAFSQDHIDVRELSATLGQGRVAADGVVRITEFRPGDVRLALRATTATVDIPNLYTGQVDASLNISGPAIRPTLSGQMTLSNGVVSPGGSAGPGELAGTSSLALDMTLEAGKDTTFTLGAIRAQVEGAVHVGGTLGNPLLSGRVTSPEGEVAFLGSTFRLTDGQAVFSESLGVEPQISARAQQVYGDTIVFLDVNGPATHPELSLTSNPPLPKEELVTLVARNAGILGEPEAVLGQGLGRYLLGSVRDALHLNEFTIAYSRESPLTLRVGKFLLQNVYLTLSEVWSGPTNVPTTAAFPLGTSLRRLQTGQSYAVGGLEYFFSPNVLMTLNVDTLGGSGVFVLTRFPF